jgi:hypothetical protein
MKGHFPSSLAVKSFTGLELKVGTMNYVFSGSEPGAGASQLEPVIYI